MNSGPSCTRCLQWIHTLKCQSTTNSFQQVTGLGCKLLFAIKVAHWMIICLSLVIVLRVKFWLGRIANHVTSAGASDLPDTVRGSFPPLGVKGAECPSWQLKLCQKSGKSGKREKESGKRGKLGRKDTNREGSFTLPFLTERAGYTLLMGSLPQRVLTTSVWMRSLDTFT